MSDWSALLIFCPDSQMEQDKVAVVKPVETEEYKTVEPEKIVESVAQQVKLVEREQYIPEQYIPEQDTTFFRNTSTANSGLDINVLISGSKQIIKTAFLNAKTNIIQEQSKAQLELIQILKSANDKIDESKSKIDAARASNLITIKNAIETPFNAVKAELLSTIANYPSDYTGNNLSLLLENLSDKIDARNAIKEKYETVLQGILNNIGSSSGSDSDPIIDDDTLGGSLQQINERNINDPVTVTNIYLGQTEIYKVYPVTGGIAYINNIRFPSTKVKQNVDLTTGKYLSTGVSTDVLYTPNSASNDPYLYCKITETQTNITTTATTFYFKGTKTVYNLDGTINKIWPINAAIFDPIPPINKNVGLGI